MASIRLTQGSRRSWFANILNNAEFYCPATHRNRMSMEIGGASCHSNKQDAGYGQIVAQGY